MYLWLSNPADQLEDDEKIGPPDHYADFTIMREMGWDYWTFQKQPDFWVDICGAFIHAERHAKMKTGV